MIKSATFKKTIDGMVGIIYENNTYSEAYIKEEQLNALFKHLDLSEPDWDEWHTHAVIGKHLRKQFNCPVTINLSKAFSPQKILFT
jgi:hypothetical protein